MNEKPIHEYKIGTYHVSQIGNSHPDLGYDEYSGPCIREGYWEYLNPIKQNIATLGNFQMGEIIHEKIQEFLKINEPATIVEFPLRLWVKDIIISGSVDAVIFSEDGVSIVDFKSASQYTLPKGDYDKNPTHFTQVMIYAYILQNHIFCKKIKIKDISVVYISKHNLGSFKQTEEYNNEEAEMIFMDFIDRCFYLDKCLKNKEIPIPDYHKWCKYCRYLRRCLEVGDTEPIMVKNRLKGLKTKEVETDA